MLIAHKWSIQGLLYPLIVLYIQGFDFGEEVVAREQGEVAQVGMR